MGTYNPNYKSTYNLLRGLRGLVSAVITGVVSRVQDAVEQSQLKDRRETCRRELRAFTQGASYIFPSPNEV